MESNKNENSSAFDTNSCHLELGKVLNKRRYSYLINSSNLIVEMYRVNSLDTLYYIFFTIFLLFFF